MKNFDFTLILSNVDDISEAAEVLYGTGCDDALVGVSNHIPYAAFDRQAESLADAVRLAIRDVHAAGYGVVRIEPSDGVTASEIARRTQRSRESIRQLQQGDRGPGGFPAPVAGTVSESRIWRWHQVAAWLDVHGYLDSPDTVAEARFLATINAVLDLVDSADSFAAIERLWQEIKAA